VMVVSEQGNGFPFAKWTCYDHGLQSAMVVRWPGKVKAGAVTDAMVEYVDVTPTFIDAASGKAVNGLDGKSFLPVLRGETQTHKQHVFGIMTTRGIINGTDAFAIRSVRGMRYKLILNLNHESKFTNACTKSPAFKSMVAKAATGDATAKRLVHNYHHRPAVELFDLKTDPLEMSNLAGQTDLKKVQINLRAKLEAWMKAQGDEGVVTELKSKERQGRGKPKKK
jgi:N-sulfoglucosamine sulfohydrolase